MEAISGGKIKGGGGEEVKIKVGEVECGGCTIRRKDEVMVYRLMRHIEFDECRNGREGSSVKFGSRNQY